MNCPPTKFALFDARASALINFSHMLLVAKALLLGSPAVNSGLVSKFLRRCNIIERFCGKRNKHVFHGSFFLENGDP